MLNRMIKKLVHLIGIHDYQLKMIQGGNRYYECSICGDRVCDPNPFSSYIPIDTNWLNRKS